MKFSTKVRDKIKNRAHGSCEVCGFTIGYSAQIHHRKPRGMGGSRSKQSGSISNGLFIHPKCHAQIESDRNKAMSMGFLIYQGDDPCNVPVRLWYGWHYLNNDGSVTQYQKEVDRGEASLPSGLNVFSDVERVFETKNIQRVEDVVLDAVHSDESKNGSPANA
jgi:5-methylcytosine-specific restriction protein A